MSAFNLPPGVSLSDEHINPSDTWEKIMEGIQRDCDKEGMTDVDCFVAWQLGLSAWKETHKLGGKFRHE